MFINLGLQYSHRCIINESRFSSTIRKFYPFSILFEIQILSKIEANCSKQTGKKDKFKDK